MLILNKYCGESGMGAMTSPEIYNLLRERKRARLARAFADGRDGPVIVGCPRRIPFPGQQDFQRQPFTRKLVRVRGLAYLQSQIPQQARTFILNQSALQPFERARIFRRLFFLSFLPA